jgi:hypothetical protein
VAQADSSFAEQLWTVRDRGRRAAAAGAALRQLHCVGASTAGALARRLACWASEDAAAGVAAAAARWHSLRCTAPSSARRSRQAADLPHKRRVGRQPLELSRRSGCAVTTVGLVHDTVQL